MLRCSKAFTSILERFRNIFSALVGFLLTLSCPICQVKATPTGWSKTGTMAPCMKCVLIQQINTYSPNHCCTGVPKPSNACYKGLGTPMQQWLALLTSSCAISLVKATPAGWSKIGNNGTLYGLCFDAKYQHI
jgi:hypothetical protein